MEDDTLYPLTVPDIYSPLRFSIERVGDNVYLTILVGVHPEHDGIGNPFEQYEIGKAQTLPHLF